MKHLEDKRSCPSCGEQLHQRPYVMSRGATENVLSLRAIAWVLVAVLVLEVVLRATA